MAIAIPININANVIIIKGVIIEGSILGFDNLLIPRSTTNSGFSSASVQPSAGYCINTCTALQCTCRLENTPGDTTDSCLQCSSIVTWSIISSRAGRYLLRNWHVVCALDGFVCTCVYALDYLFYMVEVYLPSLQKMPAVS